MFKLVSGFEPKGNQPRAIKELVAGIKSGARHQTLLGVTGSGKTFSVANVIAAVGRPALVIAPNKTLAAQLFAEFKELFPENAVEYFVSYYDYYQPEAYVPQKDLYIEKDSCINEDIDKLRHSATRSILSRNDVIIVASVSCIYGLGDPAAYRDLTVSIEKMGTRNEYMSPFFSCSSRDEILKRLIKIQYERNDVDFHRGTFRVRGDVLDIFPAYEEDRSIRVEFFGDTVDSIFEMDPLRGKKLRQLAMIEVYPASHYVAEDEQMKKAVVAIQDELRERIQLFKKNNKLLEAQRIEQRTMFDIEMMEEIGFCKGIENYSRHIIGRSEGEPPPTLLDYFPKDFLLFIDESHITVPQLNGMYNGDRSRKETLVEYGFRLPSALDNRPLKFSEFEKKIKQVVYVSATPSEYELKKSEGVVVEQVIRPTGLIDPPVSVRSAKGQVDDLLAEIQKRVEKNERVLVTTLTKKMAEDLTDYYRNLGVEVRYLHSDIETLERVEILRDLRLGKFDVLIGINLLREGLDLPEVSLVAILDADKEGFLRSERSLIQTFGRTARNVNGEVILYADTKTNSMKRAMAETKRRRKLQKAYNKKHGLTPETIKKEISNVLHSIFEKDYYTVPLESGKKGISVPIHEIPRLVDELRREMKKASENMDFERAAEIRDQIKELKKEELTVGVES